MRPIRHDQPILFRAQPMRPEQADACLQAAARLAATDGAVLLAWGGPPPPTVPDGIYLQALPPAWERPDRPGLILDMDGRPVDHAWKKRRAAAMLSLFAAMAPRLIVLDLTAPGFRFELEPLTEIARRRVPAPEIRSYP